MGREWNEDLESLLDMHKQGLFERMYGRLDELLLPFSIDEEDRLKREWEEMASFEEEVKRYRKVGVIEHISDDQLIMQEAAGYLIDIRKKIQAKKAYAHDRLEEMAVKTHQTIMEYAENGKLGLQEKGALMREEKDRLSRINRLGEAYLFQDISGLTSKMIHAANQQFDSLLAEQLEKQERLLSYNSLVNKANSLLRKSSDGKALEEMRERLDQYGRSTDLSNEETQQIKQLQRQYASAIDEQDIKQKERRKRLVKTAVQVAAGLGLFYLGFAGIKAGSERIEDKVREHKEVRAKELGVAAAEQEAAQYTSLVREQKHVLQNLEEQVDKQEKALSQASLLPTIKREQYGLADHLSPVLGDAVYTLYIEKSKNKTTLLDNQGTVLYEALHTDSRNPEKKTREGVAGTPEGLRGISAFRYYGDREHEKLGRGFWLFDYPTDDERARGYSGSGVGICSASDDAVDKAIDEGRDVMHSCIALHDDDFEAIRAYIGNGSRTQVVIEDARRPLEGLRSR